MTRKNPSEFGSHDDWLAHVRSEIPVREQPYALAFGRMELFRSFYRMQGLPFPTQFTEELERIETMHDPERTPALEAVNDLIFRSLTMHLFNRAQSKTSSDDWQTPASPRKEIEELFNHLRQKNPYFAHWAAYKRGVSDRLVAEEWDEYLLQNSGHSAPKRSPLHTQWSSWTGSLRSFMTRICTPQACLRAHLVPSLPSRLRAYGPNARCPGNAYGGVGGMYIRVISFGTNWWAMRSRAVDDPFCFRRKAAYFNAAALMSGRRLHHSAIFPGQVRFNGKSGFDPEFPLRTIGKTFLCSAPRQFAGKMHLLFERRIAATISRRLPGHSQIRRAWCNPVL